MADDPGPTSFWTQSNALLRKNLTFQKRNVGANLRLIAIPFFLCVLLSGIQTLFQTQYHDSDGKCGCSCIDPDRDGKCETICGIQYSTSDQASFCSIPSPPQWIPLLQIPKPEYRAVQSGSVSYTNLPSESCRRTGTCPATMLFTGNNQSLGEILAGNMYSGSWSPNSSDLTDGLGNNVLGSASQTEYTNHLEPAVISDLPIYNVQPHCTVNSTSSISFHQSSLQFHKQMRCVEGLNIWRNSSSEVNNDLYSGFHMGNPAGKINEFAAAFDFLNTDKKGFRVNIWYNSSYKNDSGGKPVALVRVPRLVNLATNAYIGFLQGPNTKIEFAFVKEMPKPETRLKLDIASIIGPLFFTWVILLLFPVILTSLVYEKQQRLRLMMKMHGLTDLPYWVISYAYFLFISLLYIICFVIFGSAIGLKFFRLNDYSIQFLFYLVYINLQIAMVFLASSMFSNVKTATIIAYLYVFGTGLLGAFLFQFFLQDISFPRELIMAMELYPGFSLYRGLYELSQFAFLGSYTNTSGMKWEDFGSSGMKQVFLIMLVEWLLILALAIYVDHITYSGTSPLSFLRNFLKKSPLQNSEVLLQMVNPNVIHERKKVEEVGVELGRRNAIVCDNLKKIYEGEDGNPPKSAVKGISLAVCAGECFGLLGPNGAGKTSFIHMMTGLTKPTSGTAFVHGLDVLTDMERIYTRMGVCPQQDLLWESLTGREHLLFYGRLKNLKGPALSQAVEDSLESLNLIHGGVADKQAGKYSGGTKRRLSVAISMIGNPNVVYMDEPSSGLDPASRKSLWNVVKRAKPHRAIILTTHSMEEAEVLCDRLGILVDGSLQCVGNPKELKARYGGSYVFTMTTSMEDCIKVDELVRSLSSNAKKTYQISGTQKFDLPKEDVKLADVFGAVENAKAEFPVFAWGLADTTLEEVFVKVATQALNVLS